MAARPDLKGKRKASQADSAAGGDEAYVDVENGAGDKATKQKKKVKVGARASIACKTCRKRKVRCSAEWPICTFCANRKLPCVYDGHPAEHGGSFLAGPSGIVPNIVPAIEAEMPNEEIVLDALVVFFDHYHDTFPFLHRPTLTDDVKSGTAPKELICCILALAARFCIPLRELHPSSLSAAPEHYARLASELLTLPETAPGQPALPPSADTPISLMRCQCFLILGFYELTAGRDNSGWLKIGTALRMAQVLRLGFEDEIPYMGEDDNDPSNPRTRYGHDPLLFETRRRTWWALFALDRTVSDGNERPCGLKVPRIASLRMPGTDAAFLAGERSIGAKFDPDPPAWSVSTRSAPPQGAENEPEADLYGYTLRIADIWADVASYIGSGGRNVDRRPPWLEDSTFAQLERKLTDFEKRLPDVLKYSHETMVAHCMGSPQEARSFALLHLLNAGARHVLHRDYLPFLPPSDFRAANGPVDGEPLYGDSKEPDGWWQRSFDMAAESANTVSDVCTILSSHGIVMTSPFAGFMAVAAGTVHCHLRFWPQSSSSPPEAERYFNQDIEILNKLRGIYPIAERWYENLAGLAVLYFGVSRGALDADPIKVRAGLLQLMRSAKDDDAAGASTSRNKPTPTGSSSAPSSTPGSAGLASSAPNNGVAARHPALAAVAAGQAALPPVLPTDPFLSARANSNSNNDRVRTLSQTLDALVPSPSGASTPTNPSNPAGGIPPLPANAHALFNLAEPFPPALADFDLAAMQSAAGPLGGLGLGLSTLDEWGSGYLWGGNSGWGLAGFGGLGGFGAGGFPPAMPPGYGGANGENGLGGWPM
ncbi:hypothetical protein JCM8097_006027 [Rhodosporidiobolus ruineniae]